ncbi:MAG: phosphatidylserine decarboxylase [Oscillospiraceae bacterium]|jgi:phosphatidylserine decarboxylase
MIKTERNDTRTLKFFYCTALGRAVLKAASSRGISILCGKFLDSPFSRPMISSFVKKYCIPLSDYIPTEFRNFNEFFSRKIRPEVRPIDEMPNVLIAPCDGLLSAYHITDGLVLPIKQSCYTISDLLGGDAIAERYQNGICLVFRLCVNHYHRYCYLDDGHKGENRFLPGVLHTVRPIALAQLPVFVQNCREYTIMETDHFGTATQVEVGAMLVGKIQNHHGPCRVVRGQEKGMFLYGGSTIVLLIEPEKAVLEDIIFRNTAHGMETPVQMGQKIGIARNPVLDDHCK